ncbi:MAG: tRNA-dihydrouridine synthase [Parcubacteria group bacterium Gr01-1014_56]|nr:MAG: tRNA-dihydrouridine synthase [Parcubacteria group bacterium Gr01-1014_56]
MKNFWADLPKPFFVLAPLANVTDAAFRRVIAKYSKPTGPAVMYTEFVSADGLCLAGEEGKQKLMRDLLFSEAERPIVAQFFTSIPEHMEKVAALAQSLGFDGVDINMGCPDKSIEKQGAGAKLILTPALAQELIIAAKRGAPNLPISVKTRLGYNKDILEEWLPALLLAEPAAIALHARTRKEMSKVDAHWDRVERAVEIRNEMKSKTLIIGNGDIKDLDEAKKKAEESGADGVMLGRAIFGKPWLFSYSAEYENVSTRLKILLEHTKLFEELLGDIKSFAIMKKHFKAYAEGFDGAKELRVQLMETNSAMEVEEVIGRFLKGIL